MLSFPCTQCGRILKVKEELAGKRGKCPACGEMVLAPSLQSTRAPIVRDRTMPESVPTANAPEAPAEQPTVPPGASPSASESSESETLSPAAGDALAAELTEFLGPPLGPDELGRLGSYRVLKVLGHGGMGVVYLAEDPQLQRKVALKAMLPSLAPSKSARERFLREARAAAAIKHDHIVTIFQVGEDRGAPFLAMEFLEGEPLDVRLKRGEPLPDHDVRRIGRQVAEGLAAAHAQGMIHRDIKPGNIWLEKDARKTGESSYRVKILDFGLARAEGASELTQQGAIVGTPAYMAPEQGAGEPVDARADLFSLGCVLYRMATGKLPFKGKDTVSTLMAVATENPPEPRKLNKDVSPHLSDLVMRMLEKTPGQRPASAQDVADALSAMGAERTGPVPIFTPKSPRPKWIYAASGVAALTIGVILTIAFWGKTPPSNPERDNTDPFEQWRGQIPVDELKLAGGGDPAQAPATLLGVFGTTQPAKAAGFRALAFSPDGASLTALDNLGNVNVWNVAGGKITRSMKGTFADPASADLVPDGSAILYMQGGILRRWSLLEGTKEEWISVPLKKGKPDVVCLARKYCLVNNQIVDLEKKQLVCQFGGKGFTGLGKAALSRDEKLLAGCSTVGITLFDLELSLVEGSAKTLYALRQGGKPKDLSFSDDARFIVGIAPRPAEVDVPPESLCPVDGFDLGEKDRSSHFLLFGHLKVVEAVAFRPKSHLLASCGRDRRVIYWNAASRKKLGEVSLGPADAELTHLCFTPDGKLLAVANDRGSIYLLRVLELD